jgi:hypothetical protein
MRFSQGGSNAVLLGLVIGNLVPLVGVVNYGWDLHSLLVVYWLESGVIGGAFTAKILRCAGADDPAELPSFSMNGQSVASFVGRPNREIARFFMKHYGGFWCGHGMFVFIFPFVFETMCLASLPVVGAAGIGLVAYHLVSYRRNFIGKREYAHTGPVTLMVEPYRRVLVLHVTVILGAVAIVQMGASVGAVAIMVATKTLLDLWGHWREHTRARQRMPAPTPADTDS